MDGSQPINAYLTGNFAPVRSEDDFALEIVGEIPSVCAAPSTATARTRSSSRAGSITGSPATG